MGEGVAEADVDACRLLQAGERAINRRYRIRLGLVGTRLEIRLIQLNPVEHRLELAQLFVDRVGVRHCEALAIAIVLVLRERRECEWPGHCKLDATGRQRAKKPGVAHEDRPLSMDRSDYPRHDLPLAEPIDRLAGVVEVNAGQ